MILQYTTTPILQEYKLYKNIQRWFGSAMANLFSRSNAVFTVKTRSFNLQMLCHNNFLHCTYHYKRTRRGIERIRWDVKVEAAPPARVTKNIPNSLQENKSQIQRICKNNTPSKAFTRCCKFLLQVSFSNCISSSTQLERGKYDHHRSQL